MNIEIVTQNAKYSTVVVTIDGESYIVNVSPIKGKRGRGVSFSLQNDRHQFADAMSDSVSMYLRPQEV